MTAVWDGVAPLSAVRVVAVYQPIVDRDGRTVAVEALARGERAGTALGAPALFDLARAQGAERRLDRMAAEAAVAGAAGWLGDRSLFVNLAPVSLLSAATWLDALLGRLEQHGLPPGQVVVELNERQDVTDAAALRRLLEQARGSGLRLALDDVLGDAVTEQKCRLLEPEFVKVDGSVVHGLREPGGLLPLERVLRAADAVGAVVVAEQVETRAQLDLLHACGVELAQGWLTGPPTAAGTRATAEERPLRLVPRQDRPAV